MSDFLLRNDIFPVKCQNPSCQSEFNADEFIESVNSTGLVFADCGADIYQGITCPNCQNVILFKSPRKKPLVDLRSFILMPNFNNPFANGYEQVKKIGLNEDETSALNYKMVPAWNEDTVKYGDVFNWYSKELYRVLCDWCPLFPSGHDEIASRLAKEAESGEFQLRRLYPDIPEFSNLMICLSPNKITEFESGDDGKPYAAYAELNTIPEIQEKRDAWVWLIKDTLGKGIRESLQETGIAATDGLALDNSLITNLVYRKNHTDQLCLLANLVGYESALNDIFNRAFTNLHSDLALAEKRIDLSGWTDRAQKGKALFVDAPMGLGKSHSIMETLAKHEDLSAIIFMPTNRLCQEMIKELKLGIFSYFDDREKEEMRHNIHSEFENGDFKINIERAFLEDEVYFADGINREECIHFDKIVDKYRINWLSKRDVCSKCQKQDACRFLQHDNRAKHSRIIVTTHRQYSHYYENTSLHQWIVNDQEQERDLFLVDEDLVFSQLYQPVTLTYEQVRDFVGTITSFLERYADTDDLILKIYSFRGRISKAKKTTVLKGIDREFEIPKNIVQDWEKSLPDQPSIIPEYLDPTETIGNHLAVVQHAIRYGAVIESWGKRFQIHLPNPKYYELSEAPPHVFFDGTMLDDVFLSNKLRGVEFERFTIGYTPPWKLQVYQNTNSDLPKTRIKDDMGKVSKFVGDLLFALGTEKEHFICTTKAIRTNYLETWLRQNFPQWHIIIEHFGNTRGINEAKDCDVCIMLGSYMPSDSVEIAMALELIEPDALKSDKTVSANNIWKWKDTNSVREYNDEFAIIGEMARVYRHSEHRQALARTRYLFHDVDFYVISKDLVSDYDPFLPDPTDDQFRADIFPPRPKRPEAQQKYDEVAEKVFDWLQTHGTVIASDIHKKYGVRRQTVGEKLKEMYTNGMVVRVSKTKYRLPH